MPPTELPAAAARVQAALRAAGSRADVITLPDSARTAADAAAACGVLPGQIVKSLVFRGRHGLRLILVAGDNRVHEKRLGRLLGDSLTRADADAVRAATGFAIGGIPPLGHANPLPVVMDETLLRFDVVWAAAGTPHAVFREAPARLQAMTGATLHPVT
jgi:prolyl-tRNA editing enzyme YbaK/EbsC (Cys-tRNA(Pro) deacylase)